MVHRMRRISLIVVALLTTVGIASAAAGECPPCHPDLPGTSSLAVSGAVTNYRFAASGTLVVSVRTTRCAGLARWNYAAATKATAAVSCGGSSAARSAQVAQKKLVATQGDRTVRIVLAPNGVDKPDHLAVFARATGRQIASWPLTRPSRDRPARVALYGGIALVSGSKRGALYAVRISDGRVAELGIAHAGDTPIIGSAGVAYQTDIRMASSHYHLDHSRVILKLVPLASVKRQLALANQQILTTGRISAVGMDGQRVAFAVHDPAGQCDRVKLWIPAWHFVAHVTHLNGPTCLPTHGTGGVTNVAVAGNRMVFTTQYGQTTRVLAASVMGCEEWVVARPAGSAAPVAALAGDGNVLAYALGTRGTVGIVPKRWQGHAISHSASQIAGMSVDSGRIATLYWNGTVTVMTAAGARVGGFAVGAARAVALRGNTVAVLRGGHLAMYNARTGVVTHSWSVPAGSRTVDLHYGIAVVAAGHDVLAYNAYTGHTARLLHAGGRVNAQLDSPGAVVAFNAGGHGHLQLIPMSTIEARTK
jgi:hypothetical protein